AHALRSGGAGAIDDEHAGFAAIGGGGGGALTLAGAARAHGAGEIDGAAVGQIGGAVAGEIVGRAAVGDEAPVVRGAGGDAESQRREQPHAYRIARGGEGLKRAGARRWNERSTIDTRT